MGMSAAHCQGNVREFPSVWTVVSLAMTADPPKLAATVSAFTVVIYYYSA